MSASEPTQTIDHDAIRRWAEERGGKPARVKGTGGNGDPGILRIDFPGGAGARSLQHIPWEEWFDKFERQHLAAVFQERKADGEPSTFIKFVRRGD